MKATPLILHQTREELEHAYRSAVRPVERSRWQILWLKSKGKTIQEIIEVTGFGRTTISTLIRHYNAKGPQAALDQRQFNKSEPALNHEQQQQLLQTLQAVPVSGTAWTSKKVQLYIKEHFDLQVTDVCAWGYLRRLGFTVQVPRPTHVQAASPEEQQVFIKK